MSNDRYEKTRNSLAMTPEQALADALDNLVHDNYERSYRGSQERKADADLIRAALSRPAVPETLAKWASNPEEDDGIGWKQGYEAARRWVAMQLSRRSGLTSVVNASSASEPAEQLEDGPVAWLVDYGDGSDPEVYDGERPPGVAVECSMTPLYPASGKAERDALRERVKELGADAARYQWLREECKNPSGGLTIAMVTEWGLEGWSGDDPDSRIDAAMREKGNDYKEA